MSIIIIVRRELCFLSVIKEVKVVDEIGKMECLSPRFVQAIERLWAAPVPLLLTVAGKGGGYIQKVKEKPDKTLITVTPGNRDGLPEKILKLLT